MVALRFARRSYAAWNRRDAEALRAMYHPECVWEIEGLRDWPITGTYRGHEGLTRVLELWSDAWDDFQLTVDDVWVLPGARTFVAGTARMTGLSSGIHVNRRWWQIAEARDGLISKVENFDDEAAALEAAEAQAAGASRR
jgi:hypothetical protein